MTTFNNRTSSRNMTNLGEGGVEPRNAELGVRGRHSHALLVDEPGWGSSFGHPKCQLQLSVVVLVSERERERQIYIYLQGEEERGGERGLGCLELAAERSWSLGANIHFELENGVRKSNVHVTVSKNKLQEQQQQQNKKPPSPPSPRSTRHRVPSCWAWSGA